MDAAGNRRRVECACAAPARVGLPRGEGAEGEQDGEVHPLARIAFFDVEQERRSRQQLQDWLARHPRARVIVSHDLPESRLAQPWTMPSLPSGTPSRKAACISARGRRWNGISNGWRGEQMRWVAAHSPAVAARFRAAGLGLSQWRSLPPTGKAEMMAQFDDLNTAGLKLADVLALARSAEDRRDFSGQLRGAASSAFAGQPDRGPVQRHQRHAGRVSGGHHRASAWAGVVLRHLLPPPFFRSLLRPQRVAFLLRAEGGLYRSVQSRRISFSFLDLCAPCPNWPPP